MHVCVEREREEKRKKRKIHRRETRMFTYTYSYTYSYTHSLSLHLSFSLSLSLSLYIYIYIYIYLLLRICMYVCELIVREKWHIENNVHVNTHTTKYSWGCPRGLMVKAMDCGILAIEFLLHSRYYVYFWANALEKGMNPLNLPAIG